MGRIRHKYSTPTKARFRALVQDAGYSQRAAARKLGIPEATARKWLRSQSDRRTRPASSKLGRPQIITDDQINQMILWITGHYNRRILPLQTIAKEVCGITATYHTLVRAWSRAGYHYYLPDSKPYLSLSQQR